MNTLGIKLLRTIRRTRGQFLAIGAVVMLGVAVYIAMTTAFYNLDRSREIFYRQNNFADYYFHVVAAPGEVIRRIEQVPGITGATGRTQKDVPVIREDNERATARLISYPLPLEGEVNRLQLQSGRMFEQYPRGGRIEVLTDPRYAAANNLGLGDKINIVAGGKLVPLTVVGTAISPEFVYIMQDASSMMPEPETFGIVMLPTSQARQILNLPGQVNQVVVTMAPGADEKKVAEQVKAILEPYGNLADYPRKRQLSNAALEGELDGLRTMSRVLPAVFLGLAAAIQFVMLGRMVKSQRLQIGIMKALGYDSRQIMLHYTGYALLVAVFGAVLGSLLGLALASSISHAYTLYFNLPEAIGGVNLRAIWQGFVVSGAVGAAAGLMASRGVAAVNPAESMRPEPPRGSGRIMLERWHRLWRRLDPAWKMALRSAARNRVRFGVTLAGVVFAVGLLVMSMFANDSIDYMIKQYYFEENRYDYLVRFGAPLKEGELSNISRIEGVLKAEPFFELPARVYYRGRAEEDLLLGLPPGVTLKRTGGDRPAGVPEQGIVISSRTAGKLGVGAGDRVVVETLLGTGPNHRAEMTVVGVIGQLVGSESWISLEQANRVLREQGLVTGAMLKVDPGLSGRVEESLKAMTGIASIASRKKELEGFYRNLDSMIYFTAVMVAFAALLGFAIVYNSSVMGFNERKRELASLRVLGFTANEVSGLLFKETALQAVLGMALGLPFGDLMARQYVKAVSTDLFTMPVVIYPKTYLFSALGGILFVVVAHLLAVRGVRRLEMVDVLKGGD